MKLQSRIDRLLLDAAPVLRRIQAQSPAGIAADIRSIAETCAGYLETTAGKPLNPRERRRLLAEVKRTYRTAENPNFEKVYDAN